MLHIGDNSKPAGQSIHQVMFSTKVLNEKYAGNLWSKEPFLISVALFGCLSLSLRFRHVLYSRKCHEKMCLMSYANNKGADQPAHPRSLISAFYCSLL